jgi:hypothetical protein
VVPPRALSEPPRQHGVERDRNAARQADLAAVRVAAQEKIESGVRRLAVDLGRVGQKDRVGLERDRGGGLLDVVGAVEMRVIDAGDVNLVATALNRDALVDVGPRKSPVITQRS